MTASMSEPKDLMEFSKALKHLDQMQVTDYLYKISDYLKKDNRELFFPNISVVDQAFLVNLVKDTRNLSNNSMNNDPENRELVLDIIETLEMNRDVYRWTYTYENGKTNKNIKVGSVILVYQKIFTNKINKKHAEFKKPSRISQRLVQAQSTQPSIQQIQNSTIQPFSKIQLLNMTLRFIKNDDEHTLVYQEMPLCDAQYIYSLIVNPKKNLSVGFGYKSMTAPLFEAMEAYGDDYNFKIVFVETGKCETAGLKLEKIRRTATNNSSRDDISVASASSASSTRVEGVSETFVHTTLERLLKFTSNKNKKFAIFENLSDEEMEFIRGVKELAAKKSFGVFDALFRESLVQLNRNIAEVGKTCKIRIEEKPHKKSNARWIKLKKVLRSPEPESPPLSEASERLLASVTRGRSVASATSERERSVSRNRQISFKSGGKLLLPKDMLKLPQPDETAQSAGKETNERCLSNERLDKRKTKLLEDMSTPIESDKGRRMMMLMGWKGGALGARGDGILEPIVPTIELPVGAGLGHVPPPKPVKAQKAPKPTTTKAVCVNNATEFRFRVSVLHNILDLLLHQENTKTVEYKTELTKKERRWISATLRALNKRKALSCDWEEEVNLEEPLQVEMQRDLELQLTVEIAPDMKKLTLTKSTGNPNPQKPQPSKHTKFKPKIRKGNLDDLVRAALKPPKDATKPVNDVPIVMTVLNTSKEYELITEDNIDRIVTRVIPTINSSCKTPTAIRARAVKILILMRFTAFVTSAEWAEREFRFEKALPKKVITFIKDIVQSANLRVKSTFVTPEELPWFQELQAGAELLCLTVNFDSDTKFILKKKDRPVIPQYHSRFTNSAMISKESNNNLRDDDPKLAQNDWASELNEYYDAVEGIDNNTKEIEDSEKLIENEIEKVWTEVETESKCDMPEYRKKLTNFAMLSIENNNNLSTDDQNLVQSDWARELNEFYDSMEGVNNNNKEIEDPEEIGFENDTEKELTNVKDKIESICDLEHKNGDVNDDTGTVIVKKPETDKSSEHSLCVCDNQIDISQLDKDIQDLELAMYEADISIDTKDDEDKTSSKRSISSSENSSVTDAKRTKVSEIDYILIIITTNNHEEIDLNIVKEIQTRILQGIENNDNFLPLLKCFGVQNGGLVYSCHDDNDITWLGDVIGDLDVEIKKYDDDFCWVRKSRKMVMKINSFIPLDSKKVFRSIERYNEGLHTEKWKVLMEETSSDSVWFIIEVDEKSLKYISKENHGLYFGIDKAQFSIIH